MHWIQQNVEWVFGGIGVAVLGFIFDLLRKKKEGAQNTNTVTVNLPSHSSITPVPEDSKKSDTANVAYYKETIRILFIDDTSMKDKIKNLTRAGWKNIKQIRDVHNIDSIEIREADIIFVDYKGIGEAENEQGLGILGAIRNRYHDSKWLILFTAYDVPVTAFQKGANDYMPKNSSKYEAEQKIIKGINSLNK